MLSFSIFFIFFVIIEFNHEKLSIFIYIILFNFKKWTLLYYSNNVFFHHIASITERRV
jgi:hypothetical protein